MKKEEIISWLRAVYDKLALVVVLAAILVSLFILIMAMAREKNALAQDRSAPAPTSRSKQKSMLPASTAHDTIEAIENPFQIAGWTTHMVVAELRVNCVKCSRPIPIGAVICPFVNCRADQPKITAPKIKDSDFDGMPDDWETKQGFNPALDDAANDADKDGFSNFEEYTAGTDPKDVASAPPPVSKLRLLKTGRIPLPIIFNGIQQLGSNETLFLLKNKKTGRDCYAKMNDTVDGYKITGYEKRTNIVNKGTFSIEEDASILKVTRDGKTFEMIVGDKGKTHGELAAYLLYLIDNAKMLVKKGDIVSLKNTKYKIIDITDQNVTVADMQSGTETVLQPFDGLTK